MTVDLSIEPVLGALNYIAIAFFAATGALAAARKNQTIVTFVFLGLVVGMGGGTVRDIMIDAPLFWIHSNALPIIAILASILVWFVPANWWRENMIDWFDAVGLAAYSVYGAAKALEFGVNPAPAVLIGCIAAVAGGILRDIIVGETALVMGENIYISAAFLASASFVILTIAGVPLSLAGLIGAIVGLGLRGAAIHFNLRLPPYKGS
ncbi:TRIC cation channel family protein [Parasphingorhabdus sp.]|uniref:trimeric intracellular cation channel family protein n=1 Tax=Parasphingorhabdus sp. TaxID=2709688 RepID=UPI003267B4DF